MVGISGIECEFLRFWEGGGGGGKKVAQTTPGELNEPITS